MSLETEMIGEDSRESPQLVCRVCGSNAQPSQMPRYRKCQSCQLLQVDRVPLPAELARYYSGDSFEVERNSYLAATARRGPRELEWIESFVPGGRMLEVGCSWGKFLDVARGRGWEVSGVELSQPSSEWARTELNLPVFTGKLEDSPYAGSRALDVVAAWHVIEHVPSPMDFLHACHSCLRPGGYLVLKTPNAACFLARVNGQAWSWAEDVSHLCLFAPQSLGYALEKSGFQVKQIFTSRGDFGNPWFEIVRGTAIKAGFHRRAKRALRVDLAAGGSRNRRASTLRRFNRVFDAGLFLLLPVEEVLNRLKMGPELRIVATAA
jgi:cyclopropane fatty-acyl-phospholipid synthase-like methyltransferase